MLTPFYSVRLPYLLDSFWKQCHKFGGHLLPILTLYFIESNLKVGSIQDL